MHFKGKRLEITKPLMALNEREAYLFIQPESSELQIDLLSLQNCCIPTQTGSM